MQILHSAIAKSFRCREVVVAASYFGNAANQFSQYGLQGPDRVWKCLKEDNVLVFNSLKYGYYELKMLIAMLIYLIVKLK